MESYLTKRSTYTLGILLFLVVALLVGLNAFRQRQEIRQKAAPGTALELSPQTAVVAAGDTVSFDVVVKTGTNQISAADIILTYDPAYMTGDTVTAGQFLPVLLGAGSFNNGEARIQLGSNPATPVKGDGTLATFKFKALTPINTTAVTFKSTTGVAAIGESGNVVVSTRPASVQITQGVTQTPPDTNLNLSPQAVTVTQGQNVTLSLQMQTGTNQVTAADIVATYDQNFLEGVSISNGSLLPVILTAGVVGNGRMTLTAGSTASSPYQGSGELAKLVFKGKATGSTVVAIDGATKVAAVGGTNTNMVKNRSSSTLSVTTDNTPCQSNLPPIPATVSATAVSTGRIDIHWTPGANVTHYGIAYGTQSQSYPGKVDAGNSSAYSFTSLNPSTKYYFAVYAVNDCATSGNSSEVSATTLASSVGGTVVASPVATSAPGASSVAVVPRAFPKTSAYPVASSTGDETNPFLQPVPTPFATNVPAVPDVSVPPKVVRPTAQNPLLSPIGGTLLIIIATFLAIFFFRMRS